MPYSRTFNKLICSLNSTVVIFKSRLFSETPWDLGSWRGVGDGRICFKNDLPRSRSMILKIWCVSESSEGFVKHISGPHPRVSDPVAVGFCISKDFSGIVAVVAGLGTSL